MNLDKPILIYSNFCLHSKKFLDMTMKNPDLYNKLIRMNIDVDPQTNQRPILFYKLQEFIGKPIQSVPTVVTKNGKDILVLSDKEAFKWLDYHTQSKNSDCVAFNPLEMIRFSDMYANFCSTKITDLNDAKEQSFKFFKDKILTPDNIINSSGHGEQGVPKEDVSSIKQNAVYKQNERDQMNATIKNNVYSNNVHSNNVHSNNVHSNNVHSNNVHSNNVQSNNVHSNIDFTNPNFGLAGKFGKITKTDKSKDLDARLQHLMNERERIK